MQHVREPCESESLAGPGLAACEDSRADKGCCASEVTLSGGAEDSVHVV
jgi:hypothetical protein